MPKIAPKKPAAKARATSPKKTAPSPMTRAALLQRRVLLAEEILTLAATVKGTRTDLAIREHLEALAGVLVAGVEPGDLMHDTSARPLRVGTAALLIAVNPPPTEAEAFDDIVEAYTTGGDLLAAALSNAAERHYDLRTGWIDDEATAKHVPMPKVPEGKLAKLRTLLRGSGQGANRHAITILRIMTDDRSSSASDALHAIGVGFGMAIAKAFTPAMVDEVRSAFQRLIEDNTVESKWKVAARVLSSGLGSTFEPDSLAREWRKPSGKPSA